MTILFYWALLLPILSQDCEMLIADGDKFFAKYQFEKAYALYFQCQRNNTEDFNANFKTALALYQLQKYNDSKIYMNKAISIDSTQALPYYYNAKSSKAQGYGQEGLEFLAKLISRDSTNFFFATEYADELARLGKYDQAVIQYWKNLELNPSHSLTKIKLAENYYQMKAYEISDSLCSRIYRQPQDRNTRLLKIMTKSAFQVNKDTTVVTLVNEMKETGDVEPFYLKLQASSYSTLEDHDQTIATLRQLNELIYPKKEEFSYSLMASSFQNLGQQDSALLYYDEAISIGISEKVPHYLEQRAKIYSDKNRLSQAIDAYRKSQMLLPDPMNLYALGMLSDEYYADKNIAIRYFEQFIKSAPPDKQKHINYARSRITTLKEYIHQSH